MAHDSLLDQFNLYFRVVYAKDTRLKNASFRIRHNVFCEELGLEEIRENRLETDKFDQYATHFLLKHIASNHFAGTVRIIQPPPEQPNMLMPFEEYCGNSIDRSIIDPAQLDRSRIGEVSRLAVPALFRRRANEQNQPYIVEPPEEPKGKPNQNRNNRRHFPHIAMGLYLSTAAFGMLSHLDYVFVMVEPRLARALSRLGLVCKQAGDVMDYHGQRALFYISREMLERYMKDDIVELFEHIKFIVASEMGLGAPKTEERKQAAVS